MPGKLNLYNLGDLGVHLVETPVHSPDGSFTHAQNASVSQNEGQHGIRKRLGMAKLNTDALDGAVLAIANMPFQDPFAPLDILGTRLYWNTSASDPVDNNQQTSTNGTSWNAISTPPPRWQGSALFASQTQRGGAISETGLLTFVYQPVSAEVIATWDGTTLTTIANDFPAGGGFFSQSAPLRHADGFIYAAITDDVTSKLCRYTGGPVDQELEVVTDAITSGATALCSVLGRVYIGTDTNRIYYWSETEGLVLDVTITATGGNISITDIAHYKGVVYATACTKPSGLTATTHKVLKRVSDGSWSDITPAAQGNYGPMAVFDGNLYVARHTHDAFSGCEVRRYDGASWTTDLDVTTIVTGASRMSVLIVFNTALYGKVTGSSTNDIIRRTTSTWSNVLSVSNVAEETPSGGAGFF